MPSIFSRFKGKDGPTKIKSKNGAANKLANQAPQKPRWDDAYTRKTVEPEEIRELVKICTAELKARALDIPFLLLPFRPTSDPSAVRTFIRHFFDPNANLTGELLQQELRMTEPMVISGVIKWCWSRLQGGVVGWDAYELFKIGEQDSNGARDSFKTFIPISVENGARSSIIFDFFDLMAAIAAHGKANGFGGRKLSRMASWWTFDAKDTGTGFEHGYKEWLKAADATSHLFFAYLRQLAPEPGLSSFSQLPMSLQKLLQETEYPPERPTLLQSSTNKVVLIVDTVSPTPFALLRRGSHFEYRDEDRALREFADYEDPVQALTDECRRVLKAVSATNQTQAVSSSKHSTSLRDASWSRFEDIGFGSLLEEEEEEEDNANAINRRHPGLRTSPASGANDLGRPTTPSWADFLSSGFVDDGTGAATNMLLPPDKVLPPIDTQVRQRSSQSHRPRLETERHLEPGELASISRFDLDDAFWWVWMSSLAPEETPERKSAFGRCAVIETRIRTGRWLVMEEIVKGAAAEPDPGAYIAEKKSFFSWTRRNKGISRSKSTGKSLDRHHGQGLLSPGGGTIGSSKTSIAADQQAKIQAAAQRLQKQKQEQQAQQEALSSASRRGRLDRSAAEKTASVFTLQPVIASEASPAMKWASKYDKEAIREAYLGNSNAGRGQATASMSTPALHLNGLQTAANGVNKSTAPSRTTKPVPQPPAAGSPAPVAKDDKVIEAPAGLHPAERATASGPVSPLVPPKDAHESIESAREPGHSPAPGLDSSPDSKKAGNKLHKDAHKDAKEKEEKKAAPPQASTGFRKFFNRKNRTSKLPENAAADVNAMLAAHSQDSAPGSKPASVISKSDARAAPVAPKATAGKPAAAVSSPTAPADPVATKPAAAAPASQAPKEPLVEGPVSDTAYDASVNSLSRVDTADAREADQEFSRFDQGPLVDQPAFAADSDAEDDAVPPPIARKRTPVTPNPVAAAVAAIEEGKKPPVQSPERWAQIRKNAAARTAQRTGDEPTQHPPSRTADGDDDTSGEETIESRVARIKARVAELTGNMEGVSSPRPPIRH